ncbi:cell division protein FtsI [Pseudoclavibacter endophyticus]|uniref:Penicillin-binding protein 2 n=1 Tax=Pseudoclavibacter endophyticus TaxID=1778590 RepID=A0A6H9WN00_9MICO|nr:penicillin-binding protein 2 [Pseudoclavibacter endophyticus]KAB1650256.1 penicillin-binding protein 2 [Pseudoclavibacter endophyticus]GGA55788.1 cell division protein FtsI [Pseudoclavibacter endophyticus]
MRRISIRSRGLTILIVVGLIVAAFVVRLVDVQIVSASEINAEAEGRRGITSTVWGDRGQIVDANGTVLAGSVDRFDITMSPRNAGAFERTGEDGQTVEVSRDEALADIASVTGQDPQELVELVDSVLADDPDSNFGYLVRMVTLEQYEQIRALGIPWLYYERHPARTYPNGAVAGNLTGFMQGAYGDPLAGLELAQDKCLAGTDGSVSYEAGADGVPIPGSEVTEVEMQSGGDLVLTIDADTQWYAQQVIAQEVIAMGGQYGHITVMDAKTGKLVAVAEYPTVDPNNPGLADPDARGSRAFTAPFEPGSTMKAVTAAAAFDQGLSTPDEKFVVPGLFDRNDATFRDDWDHGDIKLTAAGIMARSSNIGIALMGERLSAADRYSYLERFGLGQTTAVDFLGEEPGTLHDWQDWDGQTNYATMFGQGLSVTAPQMASIYQALANGGVRMPAQLIEGCRAPDGTLTPNETGEPAQVVSAAAAEQTLTLLEATAQSGSTAAEVAIPGYRVGVKTGTAEVSGGDGSYLSGQYMTSMAGIAPIDDPRYVVSVSIMEPTTMRSSAATAPAWHDVMAYVLQKNRVPMSPQPWPQIATTF